MPVIRFDQGRIDGPTLTPQGYLKAQAYATRTGVFYYMNFDGTIRRELRHPDEVFSKDSMQTLAQVVVTNDHPPEPLNADNTKKYARGWTGEKVNKVEKYLATDMMVYDSETTKQVMDGEKVEVSCGYFCDVDTTPGEFEGEPYDVKQINIRYNHLAIVSRGRAGPEVKIQMDSLPQAFRADGAMMISDEQKKNVHENENEVNLKNKSKKESNMPKFIIDDVEYEADGALAQAVTKTISAFDKTKLDFDSLKKESETLKAKNDALDAELKKSDEKIKTLESEKLNEKDILARADSLKKIVDFGKSVLGSDFKDDMSIAAIKKAVLAKEMSGVKLDEKGETYIEAAFDVLLARADKADTDPLKQELGNRIDKKDVVNSDTIRKKRMEEDKNAWKH